MGAVVGPALRHAEERDALRVVQRHPQQQVRERQVREQLPLLHEALQVGDGVVVQVGAGGEDVGERGHRRPRLPRRDGVLVRGRSPGLGSCRFRARMCPRRHEGEPHARPTDRPTTGTADDGPLPVGPAVAALALLAIPLVVLLIVPLYARRGPELLGFPFFYWFQLAMVVVASLLTFAAYSIVQRARRGKGGPR